MNPAKLRACQFLVQYHEQRWAEPFCFGLVAQQAGARLGHAYRRHPRWPYCRGR